LQDLQPYIPDFLWLLDRDGSPWFDGAAVPADKKMTTAKSRSGLSELLALIPAK
jgi:hypothetical protein